MCGRFNLTDSPAVHSLLDDLSIDLGELPVRYNIAPTENVLTLRSSPDGEGYGATMMRWWLVPSWSDGPTSRYAMFNARAETLAESRAYRKPFQSQRAIIPVSSFIEWQRREKLKLPYQISHSDGRTLLFAALWDVWLGAEGSLHSCTIVTAEASAGFADIHHRQPVMLSHDRAIQWMNPDSSIQELKQLLAATSDIPLTAQQIDVSVNHASNKQPTSAVVGQPIIRCN